MCGPSDLSCGELKGPGLYTPASFRHQGGLPRKGVPLSQVVLSSLLYILKELTAGSHHCASQRLSQSSNILSCGRKQTPGRPACP